jgi:predicted dehydrogenase
MTLRWWRDEKYYKDWHGNQEISGGPLITQAIHSLELVTHLTRGAGIKNVSATKLNTRANITMPDAIVEIVEFENGVIANIEVCLATRDQNLESGIFVLGSNGSVKVSDIALSEFVHPKIDQQKDDTHDGHYYRNGHSALYQAHSNHCLENNDSDVDLLTKPEDIVDVLRLVEAIETAMRA